MVTYYTKQYFLFKWKNKGCFKQNKKLKENHSTVRCEGCVAKTIYHPFKNGCSYSFNQNRIVLYIAFSAVFRWCHNTSICDTKYSHNIIFKGCNVVGYTDVHTWLVMQMCTNALNQPPAVVAFFLFDYYYFCDYKKHYNQHSSIRTCVHTSSYFLCMWSQGWNF